MTRTTVDLAGKGYWDKTWMQDAIPDPIDPRRADLGNFGNICLHRFFAQTFRGSRTNGLSLLEVGCARSAWLPYFAREFGFLISGIDYSEVGCAQTRELLSRAAVPAAIYCADLFEPPIGLRGTQDVVVSFGVVEHFAETTECLRAMAALLKPGALMITVIPNTTGLIGVFEKWLDRSIYDIHVPLRKEALRASHEEAGLEALTCDYLMGTNWSVLNVAGWKRPRLRAMAQHQLSHATRLFWLAERRGIGIHPNRWTSPYIVCVAQVARASHRERPQVLG
jgi:SAM-dependent methyltransferase